MAQNLLAALLLLAAATSLFVAVTAKSGHHHHYPPDFCRGKPDGEHAHPMSCSQFIHCANSVPHVKSCSEPDKLVFDPNLKVCVWKKDYYCVDKDSSPGRPWPSAAPMMTPSASPVAGVGLISLSLFALNYFN